MSNPLRIKIIECGIWYVEVFEKDNAAFIEHLVNLKTVRDLMVWVYGSLISDKKIVPIEQLDTSDKQMLWKDAYEFSNGRLDKEQRMRLAKVLYVLKVL